MILFNKYKTIRTDSRGVTDIKKYSKICKELSEYVITENNDYIFITNCDIYMYNMSYICGDISKQYTYLEIIKKYDIKNDIIKIFNIDINKIFNFNIDIINYNDEIYFNVETIYLFYKIKKQSSYNLIKDIINNNVYILIYDEININNDSTVIACISKNPLYIKCGISKNKEYASALIHKIIDHNIRDPQCVVYLMRLFNIKKTFTRFRQSDVMLMGEYIMYNHEIIDYKYIIELCVKYLLYRYSDEQLKLHKENNNGRIYKIMINYMIQSLISNGVVKFLNDILFDSIYMDIMHRQNFNSYERYNEYDVLITNIYSGLVTKNQIIKMLYPNICINIQNHCNKTLIENKENIDEYLDLIDEYKHKSYLSTRIHLYIYDVSHIPHSVEDRAFKINDMCEEFKKLFTKIRKIIDMSRFWKITLDKFSMVE